MRSNVDSIAYFFDLSFDDAGEGNEEAGEWFIEGVREELDAPYEYYFDASKQKLYFACVLLCWQTQRMTPRNNQLCVRAFAFNQIQWNNHSAWDGGGGPNPA